MHYEFSFGSFFVGFIILIAAIVFLRFHRIIADNIASGVSSYEKFQTYGFIACGLGLAVMLNLHTMFLGWVMSLLFGS